MFRKLALSAAMAACVPLATACVQGAALAQELQVKREGPVILPAAMQEIVFKSPAAGREYMVRILPPMLPVPEGETAAVVYVLDGNLYFWMAESTLRLMSLEGASWPTYVIAIGYDTAAGANVMTSRAHDYLHTPVTDGDASEGGGGEAFQRFVVDELKPYIEAKLPVDPKRSFIGGHSYGGLFVSNLLARQPDAFAGYMIGSPSVWADGALVEAVGEAKGDGRPVYMSVGELEVFDTIDMVADADRLQAALSGAGFKVTHKVHAEQTHTMEPNIWFAEGLRHLLTEPKP
jgi:predicted alpha/beta superfamily hydrolase